MHLHLNILSKDCEKLKKPFRFIWKFVLLCLMSDQRFFRCSGTLIGFDFTAFNLFTNRTEISIFRCHCQSLSYLLLNILYLRFLFNSFLLYIMLNATAPIIGQVLF